MPSAVKGQTAELTCDFRANMQDEGQRKQIVISRLTNTSRSGEEEYIAVCAVDGHPDYKCDQTLPGPTRLNFSSITWYLTVGLSSVSQEDEGEYMCEVSDVARPKAEKCHFALETPEEKNNTVGVVLGVLGAIVVVVIAACLCYCNRDKVRDCFNMRCGTGATRVPTDSKKSVGNGISSTKYLGPAKENSL
ncbi:uncharacterized protein LOC143291472 isoform X2 [Babylonia areolata]